VEANPLATGHASPNAMVKALPEEINLGNYERLQLHATTADMQPS
jgi:hypothetical protein